jgi:hypothetical protein
VEKVESTVNAVHPTDDTVRPETRKFAEFLAEHFGTLVIVTIDANSSQYTVPGIDVVRLTRSAHLGESLVARISIDYANERITAHFTHRGWWHSGYLQVSNMLDLLSFCAFVGFGPASGGNEGA